MAMDAIDGGAIRSRADQLTAHESAFDRRRFLAASGLLGISTVGVSIGSEASASPKSVGDPVSMAMHIHGSFSEGIASMEAHLEQARRHGVDVIWWTDHDFRRTAHGYRQKIAFDGEHEQEGHWDLTWHPVRSGGVAASDLSFVTAPYNPSEPGQKMQVTMTAHPRGDWSSYQAEAKAQNVVYSTSYCDTSIELDVMLLARDGDARIVIEIVSSYRPARGDRPAGQYRIQYRIGGPVGRSKEKRGLVGVVGLPPVDPEVWRTITLDPRADHAALWPDTVADDASLWRLRFGVQARQGGSATAVFDRLTFRRGRDTADDPTARFSAVVEEYRARYPNITQYAAAEVSLVLHLNAFGGTGRFPHYASPQAVKNPSLSAQREMVTWLHGQGAVVSLNHPLAGAKGPDDLARRLITTRGQGVDVIEIGTGRDPFMMGRVLDAASRNGVFLTANGTTDDHRGTDWMGRRRRWLTRVWSPTTQQADLCAALRGGRAWFYDPLRWDGLFDLNAGGTTPMGHVKFTRRGVVDVGVRATDLPAGSHLRMVIGKCDFAGPRRVQPLNRTLVVAARNIRRGRHVVPVKTASGVYVRAMVVLASGKLAGFSNPLWILPEARRETVRVPASRR
jgi:predicted metal-dependent phosphoesterase TrpH